MKLAKPVFRHFIPTAKNLIVYVPPGTSTEYTIDLRRQLIQGAWPIDPKLISTTGNDPTKPQFQGGYRCTIQIVDQPTNGSVAYSDDKLGLTYKPRVGYIGIDAFGYRLVNIMGQQSDVACISLYVRIQKPRTP